MPNEIITTAEAAERLGVNVNRVKKLINLGRIAATKHGRDWAVDAESVKSFRRLPEGRQPTYGQKKITG